MGPGDMGGDCSTAPSLPPAGDGADTSGDARVPWVTVAYGCAAGAPGGVVLRQGPHLERRRLESEGVLPEAGVGMDKAAME